ncbi:MAG: shikimate dehydrogenase [Leucobacter sp.]|nr:shikimate dehydrogenase [Leucobacter sp.]
MTDRSAEPDARAPGGDPKPKAARPELARLAVLGSPIAHSRSPRIHRAAYDVLGLPWEYVAVECAEAGLEAWLRGRDESWRGLSLTMPLKDEARRLSAVIDPVAEESGVVNTLLRVAGGRWAGFNTDVGGLAAAIRNAGLDAREVSILGSGATAVSAVLAARRLGAERVHLFARREEAAQRLADRFDGTAELGLPPLRADAEPLLGDATGRERFAARDRVAGTTLVISTLPGHGMDARNVLGPIGLAPLFDVAYDPWPSELAMLSEASGQPAVPGTDMLVEQALLQVRIFVNGDPGTELEREGDVLAAMRTAVND